MKRKLARVGRIAATSALAGIAAFGLPHSRVRETKEKAAEPQAAHAKLREGEHQKANVQTFRNLWSIFRQRKIPDAIEWATFCSFFYNQGANRFSFEEVKKMSDFCAGARGKDGLPLKPRALFFVGEYLEAMKKDAAPNPRLASAVRFFDSNKGILKKISRTVGSKEKLGAVIDFEMESELEPKPKADGKRQTRRITFEELEELDGEDLFTMLRRLS